MSVNGRFDSIRREDLLLLAERYGVRRAASLLADVRAAIDNWSGFAHGASLSQTTSDKVAKDFQVV